MEILTVSDEAFASLRNALPSGELIGSYSKDGSLRHVNLVRHVVIVSLEEDDERLGITRGRSHAEAETLALRILKRAEQQGNAVTFHTHLSR